MVLIKSISGIRGIVGGRVKEGLNPLDVVRFTSGYAKWIKKQGCQSKTVIIGRDARISGHMLNGIVCSTLNAYGLNVIDVGLSTTPTIEVAVQLEKAAGGIILTASHNPIEWNALKLLDSQGEFLSDFDGKEVLGYAEMGDFYYEDIRNLGTYLYDDSFNQKHIKQVLELDLVDIELVKKANFKVVLDAVNSTGGFMVPDLLSQMGVKCVKLYCEPNGNFPHNPEPLAENLTEISKMVVEQRADLGIVVDPDVDRLAFICEDGSMFGEEYTIVAIADYVLSKTPGSTVSNLSSTRALRDVSCKYRCDYSASAVGEVNVVKEMKRTNAVFGGEGNGGVIYPKSHYGRDALVGIALFLTQLAERKLSAKQLRSTYPSYFMSKNKVDLNKDVNIDSILEKIAENYKNDRITTIDGLKIEFDTEWVHLRRSNTEPIIRVYSESKSVQDAEELATRFISEIKNLI